VIIRLCCAAVLGGLIGGAELAAHYRDRPGAAVLAPSGLMYILVNAAASAIALIAVETAGWRFGLPEPAPPTGVYVVQVLAAGLGAAALFRVSFALAHDRSINLGPIAILHGMLRIVDAALERKRALSRLAHNDLAGLSFARDHAALTELCCHALQRFELAEAQRLGELASDLSRRDDLTDADKLDCFGLELTRLVGERALRTAAERLRDRPLTEERSEGLSQGPSEGRRADVTAEGAAERAVNGAAEPGADRATMTAAERTPDGVPEAPGVERRGETTRPAAPEPVPAQRGERPRGASRLAGASAGRPPRRSERSVGAGRPGGDALRDS
jgi:hypothetical protein